MPLFSRRRGSSASRQPLPLNPSTSYAANAAARAVTGARPATSDGLSSAAAAAALRSLTTTPEPVGSIQTKRMIRRGSQSSIGSSSMVSGRGGVGRGGTAQRRGSQSSMAERTFRSPSPGRSSSITSATLSPPSNAPPVPALPKNIPRGQKRSASVDTPLRIYSPPPGGRASRSDSVDRSSMPPPPASRKGARLSDVREELERSESQKGLNFSRPRTSQPNSPTASPTTDKFTHGTGAWFAQPVTTNNTSSSDPPAAGREEDVLTAKLARIQAARGEDVKNRTLPKSSQGTHLSRATQPGAIVAAEASVPANEPMETVMVYDSNSRTFVPQLRPKAKATAPPSPTLPPPPAPAPGTYDPATRTIVPLPQVPSQPGMAQSMRSDPDTDPELQPRDETARLSPNNNLRSSPVPEQRGQDEIPDTAAEDLGRYLRASAGSAKVYVANKSQTSSSLHVPPREGTGSIRTRDASASPASARAHFSASPISPHTLHDPPPRDISPAKSAMKHSPASSLRTGSPLAHFAGYKSPPSEISDTASQVSHDAASGRKKKSVRVSFDEQPQEIEASTAVAGPKVHGRDRTVLGDHVDDEDFSKPRPALPSFGSVRKNRIVAEKVTEMAPERLEHSNDRAIGSILRSADGTATSPELDTPEAADAEDPDNSSDDSDSDVQVSETTLAGPQPALVTAQVHVEPSQDSPKSPIDPVVRDFGSTAKSDVPSISLLPPTPGFDNAQTFDENGEDGRTVRRSHEIVVPGSWSGEHPSEATLGSATSTATAAATPAQDSNIAPVMTQSPEEKSPILDPIDESDSDDAFSDAEEDLSHLDDGGFASLDAIAVSPVATAKSAANRPAPANASSPPESPVGKKATKKTDAGRKEASETDSGDWTSATTYWSQLSKQQREQIERDHLSSDDEARSPCATTKKPKKSILKPTGGDSGIKPSSPIQTPQKSEPAHRDSKPVQPALKQSWRNESSAADAPAREGVHNMRRSMRGSGSGTIGGINGASGDGTFLNQAPTAIPKGALQKKTLRPQSAGATSTPAAGFGMSNSRVSRESSHNTPSQRPATAVSAAPPVGTRLQKDFVHDSDSESSFRKARNRRRGMSVSTMDSQGRYSMKRSMRGESSESALPAKEMRPTSPTPARGKGKDSFSVRSLSPTGSIFNRRKGKEVRDSIRAPSVDAGRLSTLRNPQPVAKKGFGRRVPVSAQRRSKFKSRFADSDDSDDDAPLSRGMFRSRFIDSDDEEDTFLPADLTPVRGIPRKQGQTDGDSTDLDDSDEDNTRKSGGRPKQNTPLVPDPADIDRAMEAARRKLGITSAQSAPREDEQGTALSKGSLRIHTNGAHPGVKPPQTEVLTPKKERRGFMGSVLRRNRNSQQSVPTTSQMPTHVPTSPVAAGNQAELMSSASPASPQNGPTGSQSPSHAGKLTRRASHQPPPPPPRGRVQRGASTYSTSTAPPAVGESTLDHGWPLPAVPPLPNNLDELKGDARPNTSDGTSPLQRSASGSNVRFSEPPEDAKAGVVYSSRTGKKKRFAMLRRAFGLND